MYFRALALNMALAHTLLPLNVALCLLLGEAWLGVSLSAKDALNSSGSAVFAVIGVPRVVFLAHILVSMLLGASF